jgi:dethiobiotin synthetase
MGARVHFITGTDTGAGKTLFTAMLLAHLRANGHRALAIKPVCTGPRDDVRLLQSLQPGELTDAEMNPFHFRKPAAPVVAGQGGGVSPAKVACSVSNIKHKCDILLVEGAGGLMVPLGRKATWEDVLGRLECAVWLVANNRLGAINHTLLTAKRLEFTGNSADGVILMNLQRRSEQVRATSQNKPVLVSFLRKTPLFEVPFLGESVSNEAGILQGRKKIKKTLELCAKML